MSHPKRATETEPAVTRVPEGVRGAALEKLRVFVETHRMKDQIGPQAFADFERELHRRFLEAERDIIADGWRASTRKPTRSSSRAKVHRQVLRQKQTYETSAGEVVVERTPYKDRTDTEGRSVSPMELSLGIVGGFWTPRAAQQALWVVTQMTPQKGAELFARAGNMTPSKSSLQRLPNVVAVAEAWNARRERYEQSLRDALVIPDGTVSMSIAVSLDGVLAPIDGGNSPTEVRTQAADEGRLSKGPAGYREAGCATVSFCDEKGDLLGAVRMAGAHAGDQEDDAQGVSVLT